MIKYGLLLFLGLAGELLAQPNYTEGQRKADAALAKQLAEKINAKYDGAWATRDSLTPVFVDSVCAWGLLDYQGQELLRARYDELELLGGGLVMGKRGEKKSFWLYKQPKLVPLQYENVSWWRDELLLVEAGGAKGLVNSSGAGILPPMYEEIVATKGHILARRGLEWRCFDPKTPQAQAKCPTGEAQTRYARQFPNEIAAFSWLDKEQFRLENLVGTVLLAAQGYPIHYTTGRLAFLEKTGEFFPVDILGEAQFTQKYTAVQAINSQLWAVRQNQYWGLLDNSGKVLLKCEFNDMREGENYLQFRQNALWGLWDAQKNAWFVKPSYAAPAEILSERYWAAIPAQDSSRKVAIFDKNAANFATKLRFDNVKALGDGYFAVQTNNKWQIWQTETLKAAVNGDFAAVRKQHKGRFEVSRDGETYIWIDRKAKTSACKH